MKKHIKTFLDPLRTGVVNYRINLVKEASFDEMIDASGVFYVKRILHLLSQYLDIVAFSQAHIFTKKICLTEKYLIKDNFFFIKK